METLKNALRVNRVGSIRYGVSFLFYQLVVCKSEGLNLGVVTPLANLYLQNHLHSCSSQ